MMDENYYKALVSVLSFFLSVLICSCILITQNPLAHTEVVEPSGTVSPTQLAVEDRTTISATPMAEDDWILYEYPRPNFRLYHPLQWSPEEVPDLDRVYLGDQIVIKYGEVDRYWVDCGGDCPMVQTESNVVIAGLPARKLTGYIGSVGGYIPQEYITYIIEYQGGYLIFTLYALGLEVEVDQIDSIWSLDPEDVGVFQRIMATLEIEGSAESPAEPTPTTTAEPTPQGSSFWKVVEDPHYGVRFAVPCFWSVKFPAIFRPGSGYPIWNYTEEFARSFGKDKGAFWDTGAMKIYMNFIGSEELRVYGIEPGASLLGFTTRIHNANHSEEALISTEPLTINGQESLLITAEGTFGISQYYLFQISADLYLRLYSYPDVIQNPDIQAILHSIALRPDVEVAIPEIYPWNPPVGITAPCLDPFYDLCWAVETPEIQEKEVSGMTQTEIAGFLFRRYLNAYQIAYVPASCKLIDFEVEQVSEDAALADFAREMGVDTMFWVTYSVQALHQAFWIVPNGIIEDDGWTTEKMMIVGLSKIGDVYKLTIHGTGP